MTNSAHTGKQHGIVTHRMGTDQKTLPKCIYCILGKIDETGLATALHILGDGNRLGDVISVGKRMATVCRACDWMRVWRECLRSIGGLLSRTAFPCDRMLDVHEAGYIVVGISELHHQLFVSAKVGRQTERG